MMKLILRRIELNKRGDIIKQNTYFPSKDVSRDGVKYWLSKDVYVSEGNINRDILIGEPSVYWIRWELTTENSDEPPQFQI